MNMFRERTGAGYGKYNANIERRSYCCSLTEFERVQWHVPPGPWHGRGSRVGAVGWAVLTGGSTLGTLGGAAVGGLVGHEAGKK